MTDTVGLVEKVRVAERDGESEGVRLGVRETDTVAVDEGVAVADGDADGDRVNVGDGVDVEVCVLEGVAVAVPDGEAENERERDEWVGVPDTVRVSVGVKVGLGV